MTVGPWKPIKLHIYDAYLADVDIRSVVSEALDVKISVDLLLSDKVSSSASITLKNSQGDVVCTNKNINVESGSARAEFEFSSGELELWYPVHYGKQPLYSIVVAVSDTVSINDSSTRYHSHLCGVDWQNHRFEDRTSRIPPRPRSRRISHRSTREDFLV